MVVSPAVGPRPLLVLVLLATLGSVRGLLDQGKWSFEITQPNQFVSVLKSLYVGSPLFVRLSCSDPATTVSLEWNLFHVQCLNVYLHMNSSFFKDAYNMSVVSMYLSDAAIVAQSDRITTSCGALSLPLVQFQMPQVVSDRRRRRDVTMAAATGGAVSAAAAAAARPQCIVGTEALYMLVVHTQIRASSFAGGGAAVVPSLPASLNVTLSLQMGSEQTGFLSASDWPNLPFYAVMTVVYLVFFLVWAVVCCVRWRDLLRIQYWIGAVIVIGFIEKAAFLAEYDYVDRHGVSIYGSVLFAELVSCVKRALARVLVIIMSVGFGITKPRLGPLLKRVLTVGCVYFALATVESWFRTARPHTQPPVDVLLASLLLCLMDSFIFWWVFVSLNTTTKTLQLRRNEVKLRVYRRFTQTLWFCVLASLLFFVWWQYRYWRPDCVTDWRHLWLLDNTWHVLFSVILVVIMLLWRPDNNNQRYAFTPLLDSGDADDDEDGEDEVFSQETFDGVKLRTRHGSSSSRDANNATRHDSNEDLRWVEENIPSSIGNSTLFPTISAMDSDEEAANVKLEVNKMQ